MTVKRLALSQKKSIAGILFILPFLTGFIVLFAYPAIQSIIFSFSKITVGKTGYTLESIGFKNYYDAFFTHP